ncbi:MAG: hypothetical protein N3B13_01330 [Deltaproteobacteria bacterium]|nr:hypothetical protein [Deltaproteobacteria bacterium]
MIDKSKISNYLKGKREIVLSEIQRESDNSKKIALYAMLGVIDAILEDLNSGMFDS